MGAGVGPGVEVEGTKGSPPPNLRYNAFYIGVRTCSPEGCVSTYEGGSTVLNEILRGGGVIRGIIRVLHVVIAGAEDGKESKDKGNDNDGNADGNVGAQQTSMPLVGSNETNEAKDE